MTCPRSLHFSTRVKSSSSFLTTLHLSPAFAGVKWQLHSCPGTKFGLLFPAVLKITLPRSFPLHNFPFKVASDSFVRYSGHSSVWGFIQSILPLVAKMQDDFERWILLNLSLAARINSIRINTPPKFSYLFQCLPIFLPQSSFSKIDKLISEFVWNKKPPRLRRPLLQRLKSKGSLALPNFRFYYWACNLRAIQFWLHFEGSGSPQHG